jgi:hypothetical protein
MVPSRLEKCGVCGKRNAPEVAVTKALRDRGSPWLSRPRSGSPSALRWKLELRHLFDFKWSRLAKTRQTWRLEPLFWESHATVSLHTWPVDCIPNRFKCCVLLPSVIPWKAQRSKLLFVQLPWRSSSCSSAITAVNLDRCPPLSLYHSLEVDLSREKQGPAHAMLRAFRSVDNLLL